MHFVPINYSDPDFNSANTADFQLLVFLNPDTFSYAVRHAKTNKLVRVSTNSPLNQLFESSVHSETLNLSYQKLIIAAESNSFCLIPDAVFTDENLADYAAFLLIKEADAVLKDQIENGENTVIFIFPEHILRKIESKFNTTEILFAPKSWIKTVLKKQPSSQNLYLFLEKNQLQVLYPEQHKIRFYNQFLISTLDELVYFTALVADQLNLKPEETTIVISGRIEANGEQMLRLKEFFKDVILFTLTNFMPENGLPQHQVIQFLGLN
ncbi:MAG: DUF3822 family protein [Janthinobacterium lividum]